MLRSVKSSTLLNKSRIRVKWGDDFVRLISNPPVGGSPTRFNEIGVQMIDEPLRQYLFRDCQFGSTDKKVIEKVKEHLGKFKLNTDVAQRSPDDFIKEIPSNILHSQVGNRSCLILN